MLKKEIKRARFTKKKLKTEQDWNNNGENMLKRSQNSKIHQKEAKTEQDWNNNGENMLKKEKKQLDSSKISQNWTILTQ